LCATRTTSVPSFSPLLQSPHLMGIQARSAVVHGGDFCFFGWCTRCRERREMHPVQEGVLQVLRRMQMMHSMLDGTSWHQRLASLVGAGVAGVTRESAGVQRVRRAQSCGAGRHPAAARGPAGRARNHRPPNPQAPLHPLPPQMKSRSSLRRTTLQEQAAEPRQVHLSQQLCAQANALIAGSHCTTLFTL
jgi:hypothetical protein